MTVYALIDCRDETTCYIGYTRDPLHKRMHQHENMPTGGRDKWTWLQRYPVRIEKICDGLEFEEKAEIARFMRAGIMLFNNTSWPPMTGKAKKAYKKAQAVWVEKRLSDNI